MSQMRNFRFASQAKKTQCSVYTPCVRGAGVYRHNVFLKLRSRLWWIVHGRLAHLLPRGGGWEKLHACSAIHRAGRQVHQMHATCFLSTASLPHLLRRFQRFFGCTQGLSGTAGRSAARTSQAAARAIQSDGSQPSDHAEDQHEHQREQVGSSAQEARVDAHVAEIASLNQERSQ